MLTRLEADDWGDSADGTQYGQDDHWYTEQYDESYDQDYHEDQEHHGHDTEQYYQGTGPEEQEYAELSNEQEHTQGKESLERAKMNIRRNDGPVSRPWKVSLS